MGGSIMAPGNDKGSSGGDRNPGTSRRGFASMDEEKQRAIASKGGKAAHEKGTAHNFNSAEAREAGRAAHEKGTAHKFDSEQAREAGRKGGKAAHERGTAHEFDSEEARAAGRKGGEASHRRRNGGSSANKRLFPAGDSSEQRANAGREAIKAPGSE
jgi:uncharacterized protein